MMKYIFNLIWKAFNASVAFVMVFALCALDSDSWMPTIIFVGCALYLCVAGYFYERSFAEGEADV